jgi:methylmalonyl-CoA/ethylmalonyl-CoA epimerase
MNFHHIGIVCKDIEFATKEYLKIHQNSNLSEIVFDGLQNAKLRMITNEDGSRVEFIEGPSFTKMLIKGISYYHICYSVKSIKDQIEMLIKNGAILVSDVKPAILFNNKKVAFLFVSYGLIELLEEE